MDLKKLAPWNWFKEEEKETDTALPINRPGQIQPRRPSYSPVGQIQQEMEQLFNNFLKGFEQRGFGTEKFFTDSLTDGLFKPTLDIGATEKEYAISVEVPGIDQKDITLEISNNILTIRGEKKQEHEEKQKDYYRIERSYGSFQRILSLPEDADQDAVKANFKNGILTITLPRNAVPQSKIKQIEIK
ncbi:MAG: Hsp20/alpha crystallin family protein [Proteobacteria bacterium]|nr:Hsp20/alpha crystallin family protein [Pseudomonadota bacterium]MBU1060775.1 Hsp20/alpha crystallin family protein [Pseudomonadota bacterium]